MKCPPFKETNLFANIQGTGYTLALLIVVLLAWELGTEDHSAATKRKLAFAVVRIYDHCIQVIVSVLKL